MRLLELSSQAEVLDGILFEAEALSRNGLGPVVIFDLDDTLLSTARRHLRILREYAAWAQRRPQRVEDAFRLIQIEPQDLRYAITDTAKAAGVSDPRILEELRGFWFERFFKNGYLGADEPLAGAADYCQDLVSAGARVAYMTGRDETMREGTLSALARHGFPVPDGRGAELVLKPRFDTPDLEFKAEALRGLAVSGIVAGGFENEPAHINLFYEAFPGARMVFVDTRHSGKPVSPHPAIPWIRDFLRG